MGLRSTCWVVVFAVGCGRGRFDPLAVSLAGDGSAGSDASTVAPSCAALPSTCGPNVNESCCASPAIPGGTFARSYDVAGDGKYTDATNVATLGPFRLDRFEITVGRFRAFVVAGFGVQTSPPAAGDGAHPQIAQSGWDASWTANLATTTAALSTALACNSNATWTATPGPNEALPINCITWFEAMAFCAWDGGFLPTEAEWNFAASGGADQRAYPWSSPPSSLTIDCTYADYTPGSPCVAGNGISVFAVGAESPSGDGRWGHTDLSGSVWELVLDAYTATYATPCTDCAALGVSPALRVLRGGGAHDGAANLRAGFRVSADPTSRVVHVNQGARCARAR